MKGYKEIGEADWVQFTAPRSLEDVKRAREVVVGPFSVMTGFLPQQPINEELLELGINISWMPRPTHLVTQAALYEYVRDYMERGTGANQAFLESHKDNPLVNGQLKLGGEKFLLNENWKSDTYPRSLWKNTGGPQVSDRPNLARTAYSGFDQARP